MKSANIIVVGGGIIGVSLAYGLAERGEKVTVLDNGKGVNNASRGNFGLNALRYGAVSGKNV